MTVLTKPFDEKKGGNPLMLPTAPSAADNNGTTTSSREDVEHGGNDILLPNGRRRHSIVSNLAVFLSALVITCIGILSGVAIYRAFERSHSHQLRFRGYCGVPYDSNSVDNNAMIYINNKFRDESLDLGNDMGILNSLRDEFQKLYNETLNSDFFKEEIELGLNDMNDENEGYTKITVPDFRDGRSGRFMHDFKKNQSCIIDSDAQRCFVMPLDRDTVLPPNSMYDLLQKMWSGFYNIDTSVVRQNMRVVMPAITDLSDIAPRIASECKNMKIYQLEKVDNKMRKRSIEEPLNPHRTFGAFSGQKINVITVDNMAELEKHEEALNQNKK